MNKYECIIIDDEIQAIELLSGMLKQVYGDMFQISSSTNWEDAFDKLRTKKFDVVFLDISIQGRSGLDIPKLIPSLKKQTIFTTAHAEFALEAFKLFASGYLLKPFDEFELAGVVDNTIENINNMHLANITASTTPHIVTTIGIPNGNIIEFVSVHDIIYLLANSNYTEVVTNSCKIISSYNLRKFKDALDKSIFFQIHRSYIINIDYVKRYELKGIVVMKDNNEIPVAKPFRNEFLKIVKKVR